jgi:hypothetical protein
VAVHVAAALAAAVAVVAAAALAVAAMAAAAALVAAVTAAAGIGKIFNYPLTKARLLRQASLFSWD